ncbi:WecB/TagA/CpsF family glycosyltransferase [bacterium]|nr:WecB/TagA/CpsF family glycosyltransferase [bacterium]
MMEAPIPTQSFLGLQLARLTTDQFIDVLIGRAQSRADVFTVGYLNAAQVNLAFEDRAHAGALAAMDCLYADGQAVVWASRRTGAGIPERINAGDFTRRFIGRAAAAGLRLALVGGRPGEAERATQLFRAWSPAINFVYVHHGFLDDASAAKVGAEIDAADPDLVIVAMGAPRQERRTIEWSRAGRPRAWWCVGALLEYYSGTRSRAPVWMRRAGLEWLFRLTLEPGRLWRRYVIGNPMFVWRVFSGKPVKFD